MIIWPRRAPDSLFPHGVAIWWHHQLPSGRPCGLEGRRPGCGKQVCSAGGGSDGLGWGGILGAEWYPGEMLSARI